MWSLILAGMRLEIWETLLFLLLIRGVKSLCTTRRCLAEMLIRKNLSSQPQYENCSTIIEVPLLEYQTLAVKWTDPELAWNTSVYQYDKVVLPVKSVWTPEIQVANGIVISTQPSSSDLVVLSNGTLKHTVILNAEVNCEINLFNYPFASDACPVAIHTWYTNGCGGRMIVQRLRMTDGAHGDWQTEDVFYYEKEPNHKYILVRLKMKFINPFITLMLPSILIILADVVSFALPLGGGERNSFKVTLVLSFTMFLVILNDALPGDSQCSPIIRTHFCVCLIILVFSMLVSMVLTRVAKEGGILFCLCSKWLTPKVKTGEVDEARPDVSVVQVSPEAEDSRMLRKVVSFLEAHDAKEKQSEKYEELADTLDKTFFWLYLVLGTAYFAAMSYVMVNHICTIDHFNFWE